MTEMITLRNKSLQVSIHPKGAELQQLYNRQTGIQYLWKGDPAWWGKHSPLLFPIVGSLKNNTYVYNGKEYTLPRHGFARDRVFSLADSTEDRAVFVLEEDEETLKVYPFRFKLEVQYSLEADTLTCRYTVQNPAASKLWFSIGAHPAFAVPFDEISPKGIYEDYFLQFNRSKLLSRVKLRDGLISDTIEEIVLQEGRLPLHKALFAEDALVLKSIPDSEIRLGCTLHDHGIRFSWQDFPYFGIWATPGAPFVCLEPWCGIADGVAHNQELVNKEGMQSIDAGQSWSRAWQVQCY